VNEKVVVGMVVCILAGYFLGVWSERRAERWK